MRALSRCFPWPRAPGDPTDPAPVAASPMASREPSPRASGDSGEVELPALPAPETRPAPPVAPRPAPRPRPAEPRVRPLPPGARAPRCSRSTRGNERRIETEHFRYHAIRPAAGRLWQVAAYPASAAARYYIDARGEPLTLTCPLAALPSYIDQTERELAGYWGDALDTRRDWGD